MCETANLRNRCKASVHMPSLTLWSAVKDSIMNIGRQHFGPHTYPEEDVMVDFIDPRCVVVLSQDLLTSKVIGYSYAAPLNKYPDEVNTDVFRDDNGEQTAYIWGTAIDQEYMGQHIVEDLMVVMEEELKRKQFKYLERNAKFDNGYSAKIRKAYGNRIVYSIPCLDDAHGTQEFFRIKL